LDMRQARGFFYSAHNILRHLQPEIRPRGGLNPGQQGAERSTRPVGLALAGISTC